MSLHVVNVESNSVIVDQGRVAGNPWNRLIGLMGKKNLPEGDGLLITRSSSIHTCFMRIPIDVLFVNADDQVVDIEENMPAWRARIGRGGAKYVIEVPAGTVARTNTKVGDQLDVQR